MVKKIAAYGGSFNPPGAHHEVALALAEPRFDERIIAPCGGRPDKPTDIDPVHRAAMIDMAFQGKPNTHVLLDDLENETFTRTIDLDRQLRAANPGAEIWHVLGSEFFVGGCAGKSDIQRRWTAGPQLWNELRFAIVEQEGHPLRKEDLPPKSMVLGKGIEGSSTQIRDAIFKRNPFRHLVTDKVAEYIERNRLYRGVVPPVKTAWRPEEFRPKVYVDPMNATAMAVGKQLEASLPQDDLNCIAVIGGDGTFMDALRRYWRLRLPFIGLNAGHRGFFMNRINKDPVEMFNSSPFLSRRIPLLHVSIESEDGNRKEFLAVNDAWVERASGQTAWMRVSVDGEVRLPELRADGALVATAIGSTGYARAMGAMPLFDLPGMILAGSNVDQPFGWKPVNLAADATVHIAAIDPDKRPIEAFVDGRECGRARSIKIRSSRIAGVELLFTPEDDLETKRLAFQYPSR